MKVNLYPLVIQFKKILKLSYYKRSVKGAEQLNNFQEALGDYFSFIRNPWKFYKQGCIVLTEACALPNGRIIAFLV